MLTGINSASSISCEENMFNIMVLDVNIALMTEIFYQQDLYAKLRCILRTIMHMAYVVYSFLLNSSYQN